MDLPWSTDGEHLESRRTVHRAVNSQDTVPTGIDHQVDLFSFEDAMKPHCPYKDLQAG